jgi:hypothetical protein
MLLANQNQSKTMDKETLYKCIKTFIMNQRQQNKCQQPTSISYAAVCTPEQVAQKDMN